MIKGFKSSASDLPILPIKKVKHVKSQAGNDNRIHYDIFSKTRGYMCTCLNEEHSLQMLNNFYKENERFWRGAISEGKAGKPFDCYVLVRQGFTTRKIELRQEDAVDNSEWDRYEDIVEENQ
jgi:hypothetical protein